MDQGRYAFPARQMDQGHLAFCRVQMDGGHHGGHTRYSRYGIHTAFYAHNDERDSQIVCVMLSEDRAALYYQ